jgi:hypothetical protein
VKMASQTTASRNPWVENLFRPLIIGAMVGCLALSLVGLIHLFFPRWNGAILVVGCVLAALEASYSHRLIRSVELRGADVTRFRAIEVALFFILLKIGSYIGDPWESIVADVEVWPLYPFNIFDAETMATFILVLLSWLMSTLTMQDLERIGEPPEHTQRYIPPGESLARRFYWGGGLLLVTSGLTRIGIAALRDLSRPSVPGLILNVLVYFLLGLVMMGQTQFTRLLVQWQAQEIKIAAKLPVHWARYSLALIGLAALLAFLLPTGYTVGLLDVVAAIVYFFGYIFVLLGLLLSFLFSLLLAPLAWLFGDDVLPPSGDLSPPELLRSAPNAPGGAGLNWLELLRSLLFWAAALGMVAYVIRSYLRDHPELLKALTSLRPVRALRDLLAALWRRLAGLTGVASQHISRRLRLRRTRGQPASSEWPGRLFRLGALSPRERILYYYLSTLRRAGQQGFPRHRAQTPHEYDDTLRPHLEQAQQEMTCLTQAFVEARYSRHIFDHQQDKRVRAHWKQVKAALQALKRACEKGASQHDE